MADLLVFVALVGLIGAAGVLLGMLAARRLGAWDDRRSGAGDAVTGPGVTGTTIDDGLDGDGGENH
jgi:hypothetical protein